MKTKILITGGSGYLGRKLIERLLDKYRSIEISTISRSGWGINMLRSDFPVNTIMGDIRDEATVRYALEGIDTVIHLAALKYINLCEISPWEAISTNIIGTANLLRHFGGDTFISMSTDKAVEPVSCYGATKMLMERLTLEEAARNKGKRFMVVRSGNILGSSGSVIELWHRQLKKGNEIRLTDPDMARYFIDVGDLADHIVELMTTGENGKIYIPRQPIASMGDLASAFVRIYGDDETRIKLVGKLSGERMCEKLMLENENAVVGRDRRDGKTPGDLNARELENWLIGIER